MKPYIVILLLVGTIFASSVENSFLSMDDTYLIVNNPKIGLSLKEIPALFTNPLFKLTDSPEHRVYADSIYYRPILSLLYVLNYKVWGMNPTGFHLTNIILHLASAIILYRIGIVLFENSLVALIAASIFAVHPASHEVLGRVALNENIYGFFIILCFYLFLIERKYLSLFAFSLALLSKESSVMLPFVLAVFAVYKNGFKSGLIRTLPYILLTAIYLGIRMLIIESMLATSMSLPNLTYITTMAVAVSDYIRLLLIPYTISPFYPARSYQFMLNSKILFAFAVLLLTFFIFVRFRKDAKMFPLLTAPLIMLVPVILGVNTFAWGPDTAYIAERFLYVPLMFLSLFISASVARLFTDKTQKFLIAAWLVIITLFTLITASAAGMYKDDQTLYQQVMEKAPDSNRSHLERGKAYYREQKFDEAIKEINIILKPNPDYKKISNRSKINLSQGNLFDLIWGYQLQFANAHFMLGLIYLEKGEIEKAARKFKVTTILRPDFHEAHFELGNIYWKQKRFDEAISEYQTVLKLNPNHSEARFNLSLLLKKTGRNT